jgi:diphthamide synthase (EF-2-diphthine--ammonia ligase)
MIATRQSGESFVGRQYDEQFLSDLHARVDPYGEQGEFNTFCHWYPEFGAINPVSVRSSIVTDFGSLIWTRIEMT